MLLSYFSLLKSSKQSILLHYTIGCDKMQLNMNESINLSGKRVLYLTKNTSLIQRQLDGEDLGPFSKNELMDRISTEAYPTLACFKYDDDYMASKALTGIKMGSDLWIPDNAVRKGNFGTLVAGTSFGCGSSREHFPMSLKAAGINLIVAESIEQICARNCQNIGLPYLEGEKTHLLYQLLSGRNITLNQATTSLDSLSKEIVKMGGLFPFLRHSLERGTLPKPETGPRPMTGPEKIISSHMDVPFVKPGDTGFLTADRRYSYEIFFPFSYHILNQEIQKAEITDPKSVYLFYDHSVLAESDDALRLATDMRKVAKAETLTLYDGDRILGAEGICHTVMLDRHTLPGEVILGTDSHTCTLGAVGALPIGIGATEWAAALWTNKVPISVPSSLRFELNGRPGKGVMAKDIMLYLLSLPYIRDGYAIGKIFDFAGDTFDHLPFDEQVVFPNMSVEGGAYTGYIEPNRVSIDFIMKKHGLSAREISRMLHYSDQKAQYEDEFRIDVPKLEPYIALPGDPRNGEPLSSLDGDISIDIAYIGSCTGGKFEDILRASEILQGRKVNSNVRLYVQTSSRQVYQQVAQAGLVEIIRQSGAEILPPGCGACVNFGPGSSITGETTISDTNRNFPGRMGKGDVYLANPAVVAASAITGKITNPKNI